MKRIFGLIFVVSFGICGTAGGAVLFFGCSQSQVEKGGGGKNLRIMKIQTMTKKAQAI